VLFSIVSKENFKNFSKIKRIFQKEGVKVNVFGRWKEAFSQKMSKRQSIFEAIEKDKGKQSLLF
jgi:(p)ppGpp synthase/HD superfamily hydrolase